MSDYRRYVGRQVVAQLSDASIHGTLSRAGHDLLELENAGSLDANGDRKPIDGVVLIPTLQVDWIQVP